MMLLRSFLDDSQHCFLIIIKENESISESGNFLALLQDFSEIIVVGTWWASL